MKHFKSAPRNSATLASWLGEADCALISRNISIDARVLAACPNLKYIGVYGTGLDQIDLMAARKRGIVVAGIGDYCNRETCRRRSTKEETNGRGRLRMRIAIDKLTEDGVVAVAKVHAKVFSTLGHNQKRGESILRAPACRVTVAADQKTGKVLGYAQASGRASVCYLSWIAVIDSARGKGVGSALLKDLKAWAKRQKCKEIELDSRNRFRKALFFYLNNGFDVVGTYQGSDGDIMIRLRLKL